MNLNYRDYRDYSTWLEFADAIYSMKPYDQTLFLSCIFLLDGFHLQTTMSILKDTNVFELNLTGNLLGRKSGEDLHKMLAAISDSKVRNLDLTRNELYQLNAKDLKHMLQGLEKTKIYYLNLSDNFHDNMTIDELTEALSGLNQTNIRILDLSYNGFYQLNKQDLEKLGKCIFQNTKIYKLKIDSHRFTKEQLEALYMYAPAKSFHAFAAGVPAATDKPLTEIDPNLYPNQGLANLPKKVLHKIGLFTGPHFNKLTNQEVSDLQQLDCLSKRP